MPVWSPDGTKIAFIRDIPCGGGECPRIFVMNADGTGQRQLTVEAVEPAPNAPHYWPAWSPDGTKIAFAKLWVPEFGIYVVGADTPGSGVLLIAGGQYPSWSPDGTKIVFYTGALPGQIKVADANTGAVIATLALGTDPCWSPDGSKIVFSDSLGAISVMNADGSGLASLNVNGGEPNWSPDGNKIVFMTEGASVLIMNADGSEVHDLTPTMLDTESPDWQRLPIAPPVGGFIEPVNKLAVPVLWLTIVGSVAAISVVIVASWKKPKN
jgi:TolB protein